MRWGLEETLSVGRISIKGVLFGILAAVGASAVAAMILLPLFAGSAMSGQMSTEDIDEIIKQVMQNDWFLIAIFAVDLACSALGGYIAARVAKKDIYLNAAFVGLVGALVSLLSLSGAYPIWFNVGGLLLVIPATLFGAQLTKDRATA